MGAVGPASKKHWEFDPFSKEKCMTLLNCFQKNGNPMAICMKKPGETAISWRVFLDATATTPESIVWAAELTASRSGASIQAAAKSCSQAVVQITLHIIPG
jgi:hypothetical protein